MGDQICPFAGFTGVAQSTQPEINISLSSFNLDVKKSGINAHYIDMLAQEACLASARILLAGTSACGGSQLWDKELASWSGRETVSRHSPFDY